MLDHPESGPHEENHAAPTGDLFGNWVAAMMLMVVTVYDPFGYWRRQLNR